MMQTATASAKAAWSTAMQATAATRLMSYPFVVHVVWSDAAGNTDCALQVIEARQAPDPHDLLPRDAVRLVRAEVIPAERLADMPATMRRDKTHLYSAWVSYRWQRIGRAWSGLDMDEQVYAWVHAGDPYRNWAGD